MIDGRTQLVGLIGWPVEHSLSPAMQNAAFEALRLNWCYVPLPVPPGQVEAAVHGLAALGFRGANVTVPYKRAVMPALDSIAPNARGLGAVNTLVVRQSTDGKPIFSGYNTDDKGFIAALRHGGFEPEKGRQAVVVGSGGAARAVVFGLLCSGIGQVVVLNRTVERAQALISDLVNSAVLSANRYPQGTSCLHALPLTPEVLVESVRTADLLVNATPVGMWPQVDESIWPDDALIPSHLTVFDLVYNPRQTRLLQQAQQAEAQPIDGLEMLVQQGALAFEMWTGEPAPLEAMRNACTRVLGR